MKIIKKYFILLSTAILFINCAKDDAIDRPTSIIENFKHEKHWRVQISVPVNSYDELRFLGAQVISKDFIFFTSEDSDHNAYMHKSTNGGVNWAKKWAKTDFLLDHLVSKKGHGWYNSVYGGLKNLDPSIGLSKFGTPDEKITSIGKIAYINDEATEAIFICGDKSVHKVTVDVNIKPSINDIDNNDVDRITSTVPLYKDLDLSYSIYSPTSEITNTTQLDENNIWGAGYIKVTAGKNPLIIFKTQNSGWVEKTFTIAGKTESQISKLSFIDSKNGYAIIRNTPGLYGANPFIFNLIYKTTNGGNTWAQVSNPNPDSVEITSISIESNLVGYFTAENNIYRTIDGGGNWELFYDKTPVDQVVFKDGILFGFSSGLILKYY